jgi:hypothetical protein
MAVDPINASLELYLTATSPVEHAREKSYFQNSLISARLLLKKSFLWVICKQQNDMAAIVNRVVSKWSEGVQAESQRSREEDGRHHDKKREHRRDEFRRELVKEEIARFAARLLTLKR